jgi:hypothetical protein
MKYDSIMSLTNLNGKLIRSTEDERQKLLQCMMYVTEKIHGQNFRVGVNEEGEWFIGQKKQLFYWNGNEFLNESGQPHPNWHKMSVTTKADIFFILKKLERMSEFGTVLYGELFGNGMQAGFTYGDVQNKELHVAYFEISVDGIYMEPAKAIQRLQTKFNLLTVPTIGVMTLRELLDYDVESLGSKLANEDSVEGVVALPMNGFVNGWDFADRFAIKKKVPKYAEQKQKDPEKPKKEKYVSPFSQFVVENRLQHVLDELEQDGHFLSGDKDFRLLVVEKMLENIQNEENNKEGFESNDRKALANEIHRLFSIYSSKI